MSFGATIGRRSLQQLRKKKFTLTTTGYYGQALTSYSSTASIAPVSFNYSTSSARLKSTPRSSVGGNPTYKNKVNKFFYKQTIPMAKQTEKTKKLRSEVAHNARVHSFLSNKIDYKNVYNLGPSSSSPTSTSTSASNFSDFIDLSDLASSSFSSSSSPSSSSSSSSSPSSSSSQTTYQSHSYSTFSNATQRQQQQEQQTRGTKRYFHSSSSSLAEADAGATNVVTLDEFDDYEKVIKNSEGKSIIYFTATWCPPCKMIKPIFHQLSTKYAKEGTESVFFGQVDVDENSDAAVHGNISSIPAFHFYHKGKRIKTFSGADPNQLEDEIQQLMEK